MSDGDDIRQRLILAAGPIFAEKGYVQATVREISAAAGANLASVNYYFGDKEKLYYATFEYAHLCRVKQRPAPAFDPSESADDRLRAFLRNMLDRILDDERPQWEQQLILKEIVQPTGVMEPLFEEFFRPMFCALSGIVREYVGEDVSDSDLCRLGYSILGQCLFYRFGEHIVRKMHDREAISREFNSDRVAEHIFQFTRAALIGLRETTRTDGSPRPQPKRTIPRSAEA